MSMKMYLDENDIINSIRLELRHPSTSKDKVWVLVEGADDVKIYKKLLNNEHVSVNGAYGGLGKLREIVKTLIAETTQVLGIRDADFIHLNGDKENIKSLFITDCHDIEMLMVRSDKTMNSLFCEFLNVKIFISVRYEIMKTISFIGGIRWYNDSEDLKLNFKGFSVQKCFKCSPIRIDRSMLLSELKKRSTTEREITEEEIEAFVPEEVDLYNICQGHDFVMAFAAYVNENNKRAIKSNVVGQSLRISYSMDEFKKTQLYKNLKKWEKTYSKSLFEEEIMV